MSYSQTTNLELYKDNADEPIKNLRTHNNSNMDTLDTQIQALKDVITNAKALLGQLGVDANGDPVIDASTARGTLGAAWDNSSGTNLYAVNQAVSDNATAIASLQDSVSSIGTIVNGTISAATPIPNKTLTKVGELTLTKGTWIVYAHYQFTESFDEKAFLNVTDGGTIRCADGYAGGGQALTFFTSLGSPKTFDMSIYQYSSSNRYVQSYTTEFKAMRIA